MLDQAYRAQLTRWGLPALVLVAAIGAGVVRGLPTAFLVAAAGLLVAGIGMLWTSLQSLTGEGEMTLEEALHLGAPRVEEEQKRAVLRALKDLEFERSVGKISDDDYAELSARYRREAKQLLQRLDENLGPSRQRAEKLVSERLAEAGLDQPPGDAERDSAPPSGDDDERDSAPPSSDDGDAERDSTPPSSDDGEADGEAASQAGPAAKPEQPSTRRCSSCDTDNDLDASFCKRCGKPMAPDGMVACTACPAVFEAGLDACSECGATREES